MFKYDPLLDELEKTNEKYNCPSCGSSVKQSEILQNDSRRGMYGCRECINPGNICENCGSIKSSPICNCTKSSNKTLLNYNATITQAEKNFFKTSDNKLFLGIEIELSMSNTTSRSTALETKTMLKLIEENWIMVKHDGSTRLTLEIVTKPISPQWIEKNDKLIQRIFDLSKDKFNPSSDPSCGMHIHTSRNIYTKKEIKKVIEFHQDNWDYILKLTGRDQNQLNQYASKPSLRRININSFSGNRRHDAINISILPTVEYRYFQSTIVPERFYANIELVIGIILYIKNSKTQSFNDFIDYISLRREYYRNLFEYMKIIGIA